MGLLSGAVSYLRFVANPVPEGFEEPYCDMLAQHAFHEIDPRSELEESVGWVQADDAFAAEFDPRTLVSSSGHIVLRLRVDKLKIPAGTLKAYVDKAAKETAVKAGRDKLNKRETDALKLEIKKQLRVRSLPRMTLLEVVWSVATGEVRLMSTSRAVAAVFIDKFEKTFAQALQPVGLQTILWLRGMGEAERDSLGLLEPERFHLARTA
jgi:DNA recombination-dependent growth factor C